MSRRPTASSLVLAGLVLGSVLTVAYSARFLWGAFARKPDASPAEVSIMPSLRASRSAASAPLSSSARCVSRAFS